MFYEALDLIIACIKDPFDQPGYQDYCELQNVLLKAVANENYEDDQFIQKFYSSNFSYPLGIQLQTFRSPFFSGSQPTLPDIIDVLHKLPAGKRELLTEVVKLAKLILVTPATNAVSERSFSTLRCLITYLRTTMIQDCINHLMTPHIHKRPCDDLSLVEVANEFVGASSYRRTLFGTFKEIYMNFLRVIIIPISVDRD